MSHPRVSFIKQNLREIGIKAFHLLQDQMNGDESVQHIIVKANLELRDSTKNINQ
jgi:LacI family transcriptional regulator